MKPTWRLRSASSPVLVSDPHLAPDLTADVFLAAIHSAHNYNPERGSAADWLIGVSRNVVNAEFRRAAKDRATACLVSGRALLDGDSLADVEARLDAERTRVTFTRPSPSYPPRTGTWSSWSPSTECR